MNFLQTVLVDANTRWVLAGSTLLGIASGVLGCFAVLRKHSLIGDVMAHAALPGICLAFLLYGSKSIGLFLLGAALSGCLAVLAMQAITAYSRIKEDTALGLVLSVFFGAGVVLLTQIQHSANGNQSGLDKFLFGQAASLVGRDVNVMMAVAAVLILVTFLLFKEFKLLAFDPLFGEGIGFPMGRVNFLLMALIVGAVIIGLQAVGVVLMAALLITPAIAARYWTERLDRMICISGLFGALSGALGSLASTMTVHMPTGPLIVLAATGIFLFSLLFAPKRGLVAKGIRRLRMRGVVLENHVLQSLYDLSEQRCTGPMVRKASGFTAEEIRERRPHALKRIRKALSRFEQRGWVRSERGTSGIRWSLTEQGLSEAYQRTLEQRLWEMYLMHEHQFAGYRLSADVPIRSPHVPDDLLARLRSLLEAHGRQPALIPEKTVRETGMPESAKGKMKRIFPLKPKGGKWG